MSGRAKTRVLSEAILESISSTGPDLLLWRHRFGNPQCP
jgi:hypothetical protein